MEVVLHADDLHVASSGHVDRPRRDLRACAFRAQTFETRDEAIAMANDRLYGLSAMVWSRDINSALQTIRGARAGRCWVNGTREGWSRCRWAATSSRPGPELGHKGFEEYSEFKNMLRQSRYQRTLGASEAELDIKGECHDGTSAGEAHHHHRRVDNIRQGGRSRLPRGGARGW